MWTHSIEWSFPFLLICSSLWRRACARNFSFPNLTDRSSTTVSVEISPFVIINDPISPLHYLVDDSRRLAVHSLKKGFLFFSRQTIFQNSVQKLVQERHECKRLWSRSLAPFLDLLVWRKLRQVHFRLLQRGTTAPRVEWVCLGIFWTSY